MIRITVLCTTTGRPTLAKTLLSLSRQHWSAVDQVVLVSDGPANEFVKSLWKEFDLPGSLVELPEGPHHDFGHTPRNRLLSSLSNEAGSNGMHYIIHLDDDDMLAPYAIEAIRKAIGCSPGAIFLFRMAYPDGKLVWDTEELKPGNVGTGTIVHPLGIRLGQFSAHHMGDFDFISQTIALNPDRSVVWRLGATYLIRPHEKYVNPHFTDVVEHNGETGREDCQVGWHEFYGEWIRKRSILDVGAGLALSKPRLELGGNKVTTQDQAAGLPVDLICDLADIPSNSYDVVTAFDVVEHVHEDRDFVENLVRIARGAVVLTTPNVWRWHCANRHHIREYSPPGLLNLFTGIERVRCIQVFVSDHPHGRDPIGLLPVEFLSSQHSVLSVLVRLWPD